MTIILPPLTPIPDDISEIISTLIHTTSPPEGLDQWLIELIKASGHLSMTDDLRWRLLCMVWVATKYDTDTVWPYLMWFNQHQPTMGDHLSEMLYEAVNEYACHVQLATWLDQAQDDRVVTFFEAYQNVPSQTRLPNLLRRLLPKAKSPAVGTWLKRYLDLLATDNNNYLRRWQLLLTLWYATCFDTEVGLNYFTKLTNGPKPLTLSDNKLLTDTAIEINATSYLIQWIADCPNPTLQNMVAEFGHPNLDIFIETIFQKPPDFNSLKGSENHAPADALAFHRYTNLLTQAGISKSASILDLACGSLASQTLLLSSVGYQQVIGADLQIPPAYWPVSFIQRLTRSKYVKAWQAVTESYYKALSRNSGVKLNWKKVQLKLADLTRLPFETNQFEAILCNHYLHHAPNVPGLLAEANRVLKPNGVLLANIRPYPALTGAFLPPDAEPAWVHLRSGEMIAPPNTNLNQWREAQYQACLTQYFEIDHWFTEQDEVAQTRLTPEIKTELSDYDETELTRQEIVVVARKRG